MENLKGEDKMNQTERENFFMEEVSPLKNLSKAELSFPPHGNHKRSLVGKRWYYLAETDTTYNLLCDEIVEESEEGLWLRLWMDDCLITDTTVYITREHYNDMYPVQKELFPCTLTHEEALARLKEYFSMQAEQGTFND